MRARITFAAAGALLALAASPAAQAQPRSGPSISIGRIGSERTCTLYQESAGRSAVVATPYTLAAASSWRTWLVKDCVDNFATMRTALQAALASSGKLAVRQAGGAYQLTGRISDVSGGGTDVSTDSARDGFGVGVSFLRVGMDITVTDAAGRIVFGQLVSKKIETGSDVGADDFRATSSEAGRGLYTRLQHDVAIAVARKVSFRLVPLQVVGGGGRTIQLNYGAPLLTLGTMVMVTSPDGATVRYNVTSASDNSATAEVDGEGDIGRIGPGSTGVVIEADDPAANGRRMKRVDLP